ncbi:hypothetical protein C8R44DRAFT_753125 [Mycena epipterygia]|nr:hypothetical protein C8R44DRAFT_753125 [Mycena epipterygia]
MPALKRKARAVNLGSFSKKKAKLASGTTPSPESSRPASPEDLHVPMDNSDPETASQNSQESAAPSEDSADSMLSEDLRDVPEFDSESSLLHWLDVGKKQLKSIFDRIKQNSAAKNKGRGSYYKSQFGAAPAPRTDRLHRANAKKMEQAHGGGLKAWFSKAPAAKEAVAAVAELSTSAGGWSRSASLVIAEPSIARGS